MIFSSIIFLLLFLPIFLLSYEIAPKKLKNSILLLASILFYAWGGIKFIAILLIFSVINFYITKFMTLNNSPQRRKILLVLSIILNLSLLIIFKYSNFLVDSFNVISTAIGISSIHWKEIALPIGISFFIFQSITYSVDIFRNECPAAKNYFNYLIYIISFPQLIAGPIVRYKNIANEITDRNPSIDDKLNGLYRFSIGLAKKIIIADTMAIQADLVFGTDITIEALRTMSCTNMWLGVLAYTFQIYFDFSGYSDMAIGLGRIMGFHYPENFNMPYISKNVSEFWKRWHITLGDFMLNYLYIPLGGNRVKTKYRHYFNLWIVFLLSGLWHGAAWNFIIWGAYHGIFLILDKIGLKRFLQKLGTIPSVILTFIVVAIGWSIFAVDSFDKLLVILRSLFSFKDIEYFTIIPRVIPISILAIIFSFVRIPKLEYFFFHKDKYTNLQHVFVFTTMFILLIISISHAVDTDLNHFIYFRF